MSTRTNTIPHVDVYLTTGDQHEISADCRTCPTEPVIEEQIVRVKQTIEAKDADVKPWFREVFHSVYSWTWWRIEDTNRNQVIPWTILFTRKFDPGRLENGESYGESTNFTVPNFGGKILVIASCSDPTDRVLEKNESTTRRSPAKNPDDCGTDNVSRKERFSIQHRQRNVDYTIQGAGIAMAPHYLWIGQPYHLWYEAINQGTDVSFDRITTTITIIDQNSNKTLLSTRPLEVGILAPGLVYLDQPAEPFTAPSTPGVYTFQFCVNTEGKLETNTGNNCFSKTVEVRHPNMGYECALITSETWTNWSAQPYGAPFDFFNGNRLLISPVCRKMVPSALDMTFGKDGDTNVLVYKTVYIANGKTGASTSFTVNCQNADLGTYCQGGAWLNISGYHVDTSLATQPTLILAYTCRSVNGQWKCGCKDANCTTSNWQQQAAAVLQ